MTTAFLPIDCTLMADHFEDIIESASPITSSWAEECSIEFIDEDSDDIICRIKEINGKEYVLTCEDIEATLRDIIEGEISTPASIRGAITGYVLDKDQGDLDAFQADTIIQNTCFREIVYA